MPSTLLIWGMICVGLLLLCLSGWLWYKSQQLLNIENGIQATRQDDEDSYRNLLYNVAHDVSNPLQNILIILQSIDQYTDNGNSRLAQDHQLIDA